MTDTPTEEEVKAVLEALPSSCCPLCGRGMLEPVVVEFCPCKKAAWVTGGTMFEKSEWRTW